MDALKHKQFPPLQWLGHGLDMTAIRPLDLKSVLETVKKNRLIIDFSKDTTMHTVTINEENFDIPECIFASEQHNATSHDTSYANGADAILAVQKDAFRYLIVGSNDMSYYPLYRWFPVADQFALYYFHAHQYLAGLQDYLEFVNESALQEGILHLPKPFTPEYVLTYKTFFNTYGSHVIINASYGARFLMNAWASNKYTDVNDNFRRDVTAMAKGVNNGWTYDESVYAEPQYETFSRLSQCVFSAYGGDHALASALAQRQMNQHTFTEWQKSISAHPDLVHIQTIALWELLRDVESKELRASGKPIHDAFKYITSQEKQVHITYITFEMDATWAELGILIAGAVVMGGDSDDVSYPSNLMLSPTKFRWGEEGAEQTHVVVVIPVENDGTPIDFYISCGQGTVKVTIAGEEHVGKEENTVWFRQVPVVKSRNSGV